MNDEPLCDEHVLILAKCPREGHVKTRLSPPLSPQDATQLYRAFLADLLARVRPLPARRSVELSTDIQWPSAEPLGLPDGIHTSLQGAGDLGDRLTRRVVAAFAAGAQRVLILGGDAPDLPSARLDALFATLDAKTCPAAIIPASDGGYVALALAGPHVGLFADIPWGGPDVLDSTQTQAEKISVELKKLAPWHDVDTFRDLEALAARLMEHPERAPRTAELLRRQRWTTV